MLATVAEYSSCAVCEDSAVQVLVKGFGNLIPQAPILMLEPCLPLELEVIPRMEDYLVEGRDFRGTSPVVLELPFRFLPRIAPEHAGWFGKVMLVIVLELERRADRDSGQASG